MVDVVISNQIFDKPKKIYSDDNNIIKSHDPTNDFYIIRILYII